MNDLELGELNWTSCRELHLPLTTPDKPCNCGEAMLRRHVPPHIIMKKACNCDSDWRENSQPIPDYPFGSSCTRCNRLRRYSLRKWLKRCEGCNKRFIPFPNNYRESNLCEDCDVIPIAIHGRRTSGFSFH